MSAPGFYVLGIPLPRITPREERGRVYLTEYSWQETFCGRRGSPWLNDARPCSGQADCGCSDYHRLHELANEACDRTGLRNVSDPLADDIIPARRALTLVRPYLPQLTTPTELFVATAWQPFKLVFERGFVGYIDRELLLWARVRAAGRPAPWERTPTRSRRIHADVTAASPRVFIETLRARPGLLRVAPAREATAR